MLSVTRIWGPSPLATLSTWGEIAADYGWYVRRAQALRISRGGAQVRLAPSARRPRVRAAERATGDRPPIGVTRPLLSD